MNTLSDGNPRLSSRVLALQYFQQDSSWILATLFRRHKDAVFKLCLSYLKHSNEAEDATMEIFEYLSLHLKKYRIEHFYAWLMSFTRNHCLRRLERKTRQREYFAQLAYVPLWEDQPAEAKLRRDRQLEKLRRGLNRLKSMQADCLRRFYFERQSYKDIADQLQLSTKAVKSHIQNGKRNLRKFMAEEWIIEEGLCQKTER